MKQGITVQERLKDLRTERHLKLEELAAATKISKSALGSYENDELKEISHKPCVAGKDLRSVNGLPSLPDREQEPSGHGAYGTAFE